MFHEINFTFLLMMATLSLFLLKSSTLPFIVTFSGYMVSFFYSTSTSLELVTITFVLIAAFASAFYDNKLILLFIPTTLYFPLILSGELTISSSVLFCLFSSILTLAYGRTRLLAFSIFLDMAILLTSLILYPSQTLNYINFLQFPYFLYALLSLKTIILCLILLREVNHKSTFLLVYNLVVSLIILNYINTEITYSSLVKIKSFSSIVLFFIPFIIFVKKDFIKHISYFHLTITLFILGHLLPFSFVDLYQVTSGFFLSFLMYVFVDNSNTAKSRLKSSVFFIVVWAVLIEFVDLAKKLDALYTVAIATILTLVIFRSLLKLSDKSGDLKSNL